MNFYIDEEEEYMADAKCCCSGGVLQFLVPGDGPGGLEYHWEYCDCPEGKAAALSELRARIETKDEQDYNSDFPF
jgi:hypothetical protein